MWPLLRLRMRGTKARMPWITPHRFTTRSQRQSSTLYSHAAPCVETPALLPGVVEAGPEMLAPAEFDGPAGAGAGPLAGVEEFAPLDEAGLDMAMTEIASFGGLLIAHAEDEQLI